MTEANTKQNKFSPYFEVPNFPSENEQSLCRILDREGPFDIEIGFGRGRFILDRAASEPGTFFVGIETRRKWVHVVTERALRRQIHNVKVFNGDAREVLKSLVPDGSVNRFYINFPDPWWKVRHEKRIVVADGTMRQIARLLKDDGELLVQTDVDFRAEGYGEVIRNVPELIPQGVNGVIDENPYGARSLREIRCEETGLAIYRLLFKRRKR